MRLTFLAVVALCVSSLAAHADSLIGSRVDVKFVGNTTASYNSGAQTVTPGLTDTDTTDGVSISFSSNAITITNDEYASFNNSLSFDGVEISFLSGPTIENVTIDPSSTPAFAGNAGLAFTGSSISLNLNEECNGNNKGCAVGDKIVLDVAATKTSVTPEPSSIALLGTGLLVAAGVLRKRFA